MISRYRIAAWRDEADIIFCPTLIGNSLKKACVFQGANAFIK